MLPISLKNFLISNNNGNSLLCKPILNIGRTCQFVKERESGATDIEKVLSASEKPVTKKGFKLDTSFLFWVEMLLLKEW